MRFVPVHEVAEMSGKFCKKQSIYVAYNKKTGKMYQAAYHRRPDPNTENQQTVRATFKQKSQALSAWWQANKPTATDNYKLLMKKYDEQIEYGNSYSFARSLVDDDLKLHIGTIVINLATGQQEGGNPNPNPQGGGGGGDDDPDGEGSLS